MSQIPPCLRNDSHITVVVEWRIENSSAALVERPHVFFFLALSVRSARCRQNAIFFAPKQRVENNDVIDNDVLSKLHY